MTTPSYTIACTRKFEVAPGVLEIAFQKPEGFTFKAGQFVLFDVPMITRPSDIQPRALSLASSPDEPELLFVAKLKASGRLSEWAEKMLTVGSKALVKGPFGLFTLRPGDREILFVATGAGLAPFRGQIPHALTHGDTREMHLVFGVRTEADLFWVKIFEDLASKHSNFKLHLCLSGGSESWTGFRGRVQAKLPALIPNPLAIDLYICGAPEMVADVKKMATEALKMPKANVHAEGYI